jgi:ankyrin repeat protein
LNQSLHLTKAALRLFSGQRLAGGPGRWALSLAGGGITIALDRIKHMISRKGENASQVPNLGWIEAADNPWGVRVLDVRPVTLTMLSTSADPRCASNAVSFGQDDGSGFIGEDPPERRVALASLRFSIDRILADGVLFVPREMEHKWALFYHRWEVICVRSWLRKVQVVAHVEQRDKHVEITQVRGTFGTEHEEPEFTIRVLDYLLRSHALDTVYPTPLPIELESDPERAAMWCMSMFGNRALIATPHRFDRVIPDRPLRTHSLLHIAVARGHASGIEEYLAAGVPIDLLAGDGLAPLHWALASNDPAVMTLLLDRGSPVDVRSAEGATPLMNAVQSASVEKVCVLLDHGADVNARDRRGFTALHRAAEMGHLDVLRVLLDRGAMPNPDAEGHTPRSLAEGRNRVDIVAVLDTAIATAG